jgi:hypothetical protein
MKAVFNRVALICMFVLVLTCVISFLGISRNSSSVRAFGIVKESEIIPRMSPSDSVTLSPDGGLVALIHTTLKQAVPYGEDSTSKIEVREVQSSRIVATFSMPTVTSIAGVGYSWSQGSNRIRYCDHGKYLLASDRHSIFYVLDSTTYQQHISIDLDALDLRTKPAGAPSGGSISVLSACSANRNIAIFQLIGGKFGWGVTRVFDLDTGKEIPGIAEAIDPTQISSVAVSPAGMSLAVVQFGYQQKGYRPIGDGIVIVDMQKKAVSQRIRLNRNELPLDSLQVAFAGESAVAVEDRNFPKVEKLLIHLWDVRSGSEMQTFGDPKEGAYRYFGASADGRIVFGYTGKEVYCASCDHHGGESRTKNARFTVWERATGRRIAQSPMLKVIHHTCPWVSFGACDPGDEEPMLEMSQAGNAVLVSWQSGGEPVKVFTLPRF